MAKFRYSKWVWATGLCNCNM